MNPPEEEIDLSWWPLIESQMLEILEQEDENGPPSVKQEVKDPSGGPDL